MRVELARPRRGHGMTDEVYTLGVWRVKDGKQDEFIVAWQALGTYFNRLPHPPGKGTLLQNLDEPRQFYSFGPWQTLADIREMRKPARDSERDRQAHGPLRGGTTRHVSYGCHRVMLR
jgi:hypothetical protein